MATSNSEPYDLAVIGGGMGGLALAALASARGLSVVLFEAHTKLGGCAGYFERGPYGFDAGATALMGLDPGDPIADLLDVVGMDFQALRTPAYRVHLPDRRIDIKADPREFEAASAAVFPGREDAKRRFWRLQAAIGATLLSVAARVPRMPIRSLGDVVHDLGILGVSGLAAATTSLLTVRDVLRLSGLDDDIPFRSLVAMLLQDTAQAGPETVPFANASACLHAYRLGMSRPIGGMKALAEGLGRALVASGGELRTSTLVDRVEPDARGGFVVTTRRRERIPAQDVAFNLPVDLAAKLSGWTLDGLLQRKEAKSRAAWSAFTGYLAIDRSALPDDGPLFHQVLQSYDSPICEGNNVLISLSPPGDASYGPPEVRVATLSTHTKADGWIGLDKPAHALKKADYAERLLGAVRRALPDAAEALVHSEFATPRSFARYTRRVDGLVGGPPVARSNSNLFSVGADLLGKGLWLVGDSVFPGQGTYATVVSAIRVVERITGTSWSAMKSESRKQVQCSTLS